MANTVGKITGQMLESNLVRRDMQTGDENLAFDNDLIFLDVWNNRVGINTDVPIRPLQISSDSKTNVLLTDIQANLANFTISGNTISNLDNDIFLSASGIGASIDAPIIQTDGLQFDTNRFISRRSNENIDIFSNTSGQIIFNNNLEVFGNLHATGNVTFDGNVTLGDNNTDNIIFNADISGNIIPNVNNFYSLGSNTNRWSELNTDLVNGTAYTAGSLTSPGGIDFTLRQGKIWYVSSNGSDSNVGDHVNGTFATVEFALANSTDGDTVYIYPGTYMENFPLTVPAGVSVKGESLRSVKIIPQASSNDKDAFLLNGQTTISDLTISNFFYNSATNTGYAFRFANNFTVSSRSPYVQNISVITENESSLASAGRGALIDGSVANSSSIEASMLFHSCTFITPNADCIIMRNGVRVEWLNSFVYYANKGLLAENGSLGFASLGLRFGAEIRSIGSANVYGNYGAWADGNQTLMYLINHNFGYIGSGLDNLNDPSDVIQANEVVELNGGKIYYQSMDHIGDFRVGEVFRVKSSTGEIEFQTTITSSTNLIVTNGINTTYIDSTKITTGNIEISGNSIISTSGEINFSAANDLINVNSDINLNQNLDITNNLIINDNLILGNQKTDTVSFNGQIIGNLIPAISGQNSFGTNNLRFDKLYGNAFIQDDIVIDTNVISTTISNSNLELRANGTGIVRVNDSLYIGGNLTVSNNTAFANVNLNNAIINEIVAENLITISTTNIFDDLEFNGNSISTNVSNADLELVANGVGTVNMLDNFSITQDLSVLANTNFQNTIINQNLFVNNLNVLTDVTASEFSTGDILIKNNFISTTQSNSNLDVRANGTGTVNFIDNLLVDANLTVTQSGFLQNLNILGTTVVPNIIINSSFNTSEYFNGDILINTNFISTTQSNSNLEFRAEGTNSGILFEQTLLLKSSTLSNNLLAGTETQRSIEFVPAPANNFVINSTKALTVPVGNNTNRILSAPGETRLNNSNQRFEGRLSSNVRQLYGLYDVDQDTFISAELTPGANDNTIRMFINGTLSSTITEQAATFQRVRIDELDIDNNIISTVNSNSNIELVQSGSGILNIKDNFQISTNLIKNYNSGAETVIATTGGYVEFTGDKALVIPSGTNGQRLAAPPVGASRWNTNNAQLEVYDGTVWTGAAGTSSGISANDMEEIVNVLTLVLA